MAKLTDIKYVISAGGRREEISLYTTKEEAGDICKGFKLPDGTKAYAAIGDVRSKLATMKRFKIQGKVYAALTEAEKKKTKVKKVYIFKAGSHNFKVPFWAKKVHYTICGGGSGILSTNAPILDTIEKDGITDNKSIMMVSKNNDPMYPTIPYMGREIAGQASSMYVEIEVEPEEGEGGESFISQDETRSVYTSVGTYNNWTPNTSSWFDQTTDNKSKGFSVYQADAEPYSNDTQIDTTPVVTRKKVMIAPTMINPDIADNINYDNLKYDITVGLALPPSMGEESGPFTNEGKYVRLTATKDDANFVVYNKGFKALYNVYPKSPMVKITDISKFINDTMAKYKVNLVDKDIYHDEDNSLMVDWFVNKAYIYNSYIPFDKLYSAGISMYNDGSTPPSLDNNSLMKSVYDSAYSEFNSKSTEFKTRYDNVTYYMRKQFLNDTMFNYDYMMELKEAGTIDNMINSSMLSNMDLVDGAYDFATGHHTSPKLSETRLGAREVIFDIQCLDGVVRPLSVKYGGSLVLGWDKYFDDAYCYDVEDIDIYKAEEFTKLFNPLSGNLTIAPREGQEKTGTWDVKPDENIVIEVGTHGKLYTEDMGFKLNKYFHDRDADGICILEVEGDFEEIADIEEYIRSNFNSLSPEKYNQSIMLDPWIRDPYQRMFMISDNKYSGDIDMSAQDVFTYKSSKVGTIYWLKTVDGMADSKNINIYYSSRSQKVNNLQRSNDRTIKIFGYDIGKDNDDSLFHNYVGPYDGAKMDIAEDLIANLTEYISGSGNIYQSVVPVRNYYAEKEHTFIFKNANTVNYAFRYGCIDGGYTPRVKLNYNNVLDTNGTLIFTNSKALDYRWYVSLGLYINPSTAKNININERLFVGYPGDNALKNKKVKIFKPWVTYDQSKAYVKYVVPKDYTTNSLIGIVPLLDKSIDNVYIDVTNIKDEPYNISPIVSSNHNKVQNVHIIDNSGITERKFNGIFAYSTKNYLGTATLAPTTMVNFARGATADISNITLKTSTIKSFESAFNEFNGKFPKNIDLTNCTNFTSLFYNTNLDNITMDSFVDSTYTATGASQDSLRLNSMFTTFTGRDISFDIWGFLVKKAKLLEKIKTCSSISMYSMMAYVRSVPFFSIYELFMAASDETYITLDSRIGGLSVYGFASSATFKELEVPIFNSTAIDNNYIKNFTLSGCGTNGVGKLVFRQIPIPSFTIHSLDELKKVTTDDSVCGNFLRSNKPESNTYKLPTSIVVRLSFTSIPETADSIEAIKTFLNATYSTPKENISVIFE